MTSFDAVAKKHFFTGNPENPSFAQLCRQPVEQDQLSHEQIGQQNASHVSQSDLGI